jgi:hypothetical protein
MELENVVQNCSELKFIADSRTLVLPNVETGPLTYHLVRHSEYTAIDENDANTGEKPKA